MSFSYYMPTRLVHGIDCLAELPGAVGGLGIRRPLVVTDPTIGATRGYARALALLDEAGLDYAVYDQCAVDARLDQVDAQTQRLVNEKRDGVICIGGGSVMCAGKAMAIAAGNGGGGFARFAGLGNFSQPPLPMVMVPTTAGSGSEVSQVTLVKDDATHAKFVAGGPLAFPQVAILDPALLESCPESVGAVALVDALTHCVDSLFNTTTTPLTASLALEAARLLTGCARGAVLDKDAQAMADAMLAASMANMSCGNARLGLAHCLSLPLESELDLSHGVGVGVLMPRVLAFNAPVAPDMVRRLAAAVGVAADPNEPDRAAAALDQKIRALYREIGFPTHFRPEAVDPALIPEMAMEAGKGLYGEGYRETPPGPDTLIPSPNKRRATIREAEELLEQCFV